MLKHRKTGAFIAAVVLAAAGSAGVRDRPAGARPVRIDYFFEEGCSACFRVREDVLPILEGVYGGRYVIRHWDVNVETNYLRLTAVMDRFGVSENAPVFMLVEDRRLLAGYAEIASDLLAAVEASLTAIESGVAPAPALTNAVPERHPSATPDALRNRLDGFTLAGVVTGGLIDGLNPCAIATLVFLISVLAMSHTAGRHLLAVGAAFCAASFLTYTAIGLGLLHALHALSAFRTVQKAVDAGLVLVLAGLAFFSFRDALHFRASGHARDIALQLPDRIKQRIHRMLRGGLGKQAQAATAFGLGVGVTALESVCTGQVYVPTMAFVVKSGNAVGKGLGYLLLYNLMFIVPLIVVFVLTYRGLRLQRLLLWSRKNVMVSKILLGVFFLVLAAVMLLLR